LGRKTVVFTLRIQLIQTRISCIFILNQLYFLTLHFFSARLGGKPWNPA
jgi:hypothetical protein